MAPGTFLGEFELVVLLAVMQLGDDAHAIHIRDHIGTRAERKVTRGALYATLERLERKGFLDWTLDGTAPDRGGMPRRRFSVTPDGVQAVRTSQTMIARLSEGLEEALG